MASIFRDTVFGQVVRLVTRGKVFQYAEEKESSLWQQYVDREKTAEMTHYARPITFLGPLDFERDNASQSTRFETASASGASISSSSTAVGDGPTDHDDKARIVDAEKGKDPNLVTWYGDNDPDNPMNWSLPKKCFVTFQICFLTFSVYVGSAIYSAGIQSVMKDFGVSQTKATLGLTLFVAGYGLGPILWAPMSEIPQIGRNPIYIGTLVVFVALQIPTIFSVNFAMLLCFRFLTGFIGSPSLATGGASIADMFSPKKRAYGIGLWGIGAVSGPCLGPLIGGFAAESKGWKWTIWELTWLSGFALAFLIFFLPETSSNNILVRRTRRLRKLTGIKSLKCEPELEAEQMTGKEIAAMVLVRPITLNFKEPIVLALNLYIALVYGLVYIWFESFPIVFVEIHHFSEGKEGLAFLGILIGCFATIPPFYYYIYKKVEPKFNERGDIAPEQRLPPAMVGAFFIPVCLFWFGWSARPDIHWIMPIIGSVWFAVGSFLLFNSVLTYLGDAYPKYAASVLAGNDLMRSSFGAGFPLFATAMYKNMGTAWASSMLGFISIAFIPIPFLLYYYGERIRKLSKNARQDF